MSYIYTHTGKVVEPHYLHEEDFDIIDIAHALSNLCRYTGHASQFYSVAEHSVHVSYLCHPQDALWGLLHDACEAYLGDLNKPTKQLLPDYIQMEQGGLKAMCRRYDLPSMEPFSVKYADLEMLHNEMRDLLGNTKPSKEWSLPRVTFVDVTQPWPPAIAKRCFLDRFNFIVQHEGDSHDRLSINRKHSGSEVAPEHKDQAERGTLLQVLPLMR